jgi:hypothetical protein
VQATDGSYSATLDGTLTGADSNKTLSDPHLVVTHGGMTVASTGFVVPDQAGPASVPWSISGSQAAVQPLCLAQFAGSTSPAALVGFFTGGAHCCTVLAAVPLSGLRAGTPLYQGPADTGYEVKSVNGSALIRTADASFDYMFASHAGSAMPIVLLQLENGQFADVTTQHRDLLDADDQQLWNVYLQNQSGEGLGILAAWVADECRIGTSAHAFATLDLLNSQGKLHNQYGGDWPSGSQYIAQLKSFLAQRGYC